MYFDLKKFLFGNSLPSPVQNHNKRLILTINLSLIAILACLVYVVVNIFTGDYFTAGVQCLNALLFCLPIYLIKTNRSTAAITVLLGITLLLVFLSLVIEPLTSGIYLYASTLGLSALTLYGYEKSKWAIGYLCVDFGMVIIIYFLKLDPILEFSADTLKVHFLLNFAISSSINILIVYYLISVNFQVENILKKNENDLKVVNNELDNFIYSASHDLRAPLKSMLGLINISQLSLSNEEDVNNYLNLMRSSINRMDEFIQDIIDNSKNTRLELIKTKVLLKPLINSIISDYSHLENFNTLNVEHNVKEEDFVFSDKSRLSMILKNIISNAIKYRIGKATDFVKIEILKTEKSIIIKVSDNGIGISPEHKESIFTMFYRASEKSDGAGLGLYIVKQAADKINAEVSFDSSLGKGTEFRVELPIEI